MPKSIVLYIASFTVLLCVFTSPEVSANWRLVEGHSEVNFISTKNIHTSEIHSFTQLTGSLTDSGVLNLEINLASVETGIDIRNTRMTEKLFLVDKFPKALVNAELPKDIMQLKKGHSATVNIPATLTIMGIERPLTIAVQVSKTSDANYLATSAKPILIGAADFGLKAGVELLQQIAGLGSISLSVPVTFNLTFAAQK